MQNYKELEPAERVIIALDCGADEALSLAKELAGTAKWVKIGMTLFYKEGPSFIQQFKELGYKVFLDLKLYDIPFQVQGAVSALVETGADMVTLHASGSVEMMEAAQAGVQQAADALGVEAPITLGVTVLTSMDESTLAEIGVPRAPFDQVLLLANLAKRAQIGGVVSSPWEAQALREVLGDFAAIVTPGIRPVGSDAGDQKRIATPSFAVENGASHIVVGRPITKAENPVEAFNAIVAELAGAQLA